MEREINIRRPIKPAFPSFKRVAAYVRVSSIKDAMLQSLSNQVSYYNYFIQHHAGWQFAGVYVDEGFTGTKDMRERPKYYAEDTHPGIINKSTFERVQGRIAEELLAGGGHRPNSQRYPFSGKIVCGKCGKRFKRITKHGTAYWHCTMTVQFGTTACHSKRIPETTLLNISANVLDNNAICVDVFMSIIDHIEAYDGNRLAFVFKDGQTVETIWQDHSRTESWTDEMKQNAREKNLIRRQEPRCQK